MEMLGIWLREDVLEPVCPIYSLLQFCSRSSCLRCAPRCLDTGQHARKVP